jgi:hypothetical protein
MSEFLGKIEELQEIMPHLGIEAGLGIRADGNQTVGETVQIEIGRLGFWFYQT